MSKIELGAPPASIACAAGRVAADRQFVVQFQPGLDERAVIICDRVLVHRERERVLDRPAWARLDHTVVVAVSAGCLDVERRWAERGWVRRRLIGRPLIKEARHLTASDVVRRAVQPSLAAGRDACSGGTIDVRLVRRPFVIAKVVEIRTSGERGDPREQGSSPSRPDGYAQRGRTSSPCSPS